MSKLPDKPSELIRVALADLAKAQRDRRYTIGMNTWHTPEYQLSTAGDLQPQRCEVCLAGAVMAFSLGALPTDERLPRGFDEVTAGKLNAIDDFRCGMIQYGLESLGIEVPEGLRGDGGFMDVGGGWMENRTRWRRRMRDMIALLERYEL